MAWRCLPALLLLLLCAVATARGGRVAPGLQPQQRQPRPSAQQGPAACDNHRQPCAASAHGAASRRRLQQQLRLGSESVINRLGNVAARAVNREWLQGTQPCGGAPWLTVICPACAPADQGAAVTARVGTRLGGNLVGTSFAANGFVSGDNRLAKRVSAATDTQSAAAEGDIAGAAGAAHARALGAAGCRCVLCCCASWMECLLLL